jgi:hypothetical protein
MNRYRFESYRVENGNTSAFETCRKIGALDYEGVRPVVLVGAAGCGKTHLIYSIVNELKAKPSKTGLAVITAGKFPREVRALADNPAPVKRAASAILLIDQLEHFHEHTDELDAVVRLFHESGHLIVAASAVPPDELEQLPSSLRRLLSQGNVISFTNGVPHDDAEVKALREQVAALESALAASEQRAADMQCQQDAIRLQLEDERQSNSTYERELEQRRAQNADLAHELDLARREAEETRVQKEALSEKIESLAGQIESYSAYFAEGEQAQRQQLAELERSIAALEAAPVAPEEARIAVTRAECAEAELEAARRAFSSIRAQLEEERDQAKSEAAELANERDEAADSLLQLETAHRRVLVEIQELQQRYAAQKKELEELRKEAAEQVAAANANAGELEREVGRLLALQEKERTAAAAEIQGVRDQLIDVAKSLGLAADNLAGATPPRPVQFPSPKPKEPQGLLDVIDRLAGDGTGADNADDDEADLYGASSG